MYHAAITIPPNRIEALCRVPHFRASSATPADRKVAKPVNRIATGEYEAIRRRPLLGLALATGLSAICWAGLAALVF